MRRIEETKIVAILAMVLLAGTVAFAAGEQKTYRIGVLVWQEKKDYEDAMSGFMSALRASSLKYEIDLKRAFANENTSRQYLRAWRDDNVDLIVTFGTMGTKWAIEEAPGVPRVCAAVTHPVNAGIALSWEKPGRGVTGCTNWIKPEDKVAVFVKFVPGMKRLGVMYNPDNPVSSNEAAAVKEACEAAGLVLDSLTVRDVNDLEKATGELIGRGVDAVWVPTETFMYQSISQVTNITRPARLPVISSTLTGIGGDEGNKDAAILAVTVDQKLLGTLCVPAVIEILTTGKDAGAIPFQVVPTFLTAVNAAAAADIGYQVPPVILSQANMVFKGYAGQKIVVSGTGDSQELLRVMASRLTEKLGEGEIEVPDTIGSGGGIKAVAKGEIDLARVARALNKNEEQLGLKYHQFGTAPVVFVVHPDVIGIDDITTGQIIAVYSGKTRDWSELGAMSGKIYPVTRESGDSCLTVINKSLEGFSDIVKPVAKTVYTTPETVTKLAGYSGTIGFVPMPVEVGTELRVLKVDGVYPSIENIRNGSYKLGIPLALVCKDEPRGLSKRFVDFISSDKGKDIMMKMGMVPVE
jgi:phosphate transport system substrate-binding protein